MATLKSFRGNLAVFSDGSTLEFPATARVEHLPPDPRYTWTCERWRLMVRQPGPWTYALTIPVNSTQAEVEAKLKQLTEALATRARHVARQSAGV